jgi:hypothetical protein
VLSLLGALVAVAFAMPAHATFNTCLAAKNKCVAKKTAGLLKCHQLAEKKGLPVSDPSIQTCLQKATDKFDGGVTPSKGCFAKLEAKYPGGCLTTTDTAALENTVDGFVDAVVSALDPGYPTPVTNACSVGKNKCVSKKATALLACHSKNEKPPVGLAPEKFVACLQKARDQFDGGTTPSQGCFAKLETKYPDCLTTLDTPALETTVDGFVDEVLCQLDAGSGTCPCVYVSTSQGDDTSGTGSRQSPLKTIAAAIQKAQDNAVPSVCLSGEVYDEAVTMVSGISVYGGFDQNDAGLKFRRSSNVTTTVNAPGVAFDAPQIDQETHIEGITINATAVAVPGASVYGVRLGGGTGQLFVRDNIIQAAAGSDGHAGSDGLANGNAQAPAGNNGQMGCTSCSSNGAGGPQPMCTEFGGKGGTGGYDSGNGQAGSAGSGGALGGNPGVSSQMCSVFGAPKSGPGGPGNTGSDGSQGTPGSGGAALGTVASSDYVPADGGSGLGGTNGKGGGGGGGGGGGAALACQFNICANQCNADRGGGGGSGGCGGLGGDDGLAGGGGGASFGVFALAGAVIVASNDITTHDGGKGGKGGDGAAGQSGGSGGTGGIAADDAGAGGNGKPGGSGGAGGPGGGGGGGPSACLGRAASVVFTFDTNTCTTGIPGFGGSGGTNPMGGFASDGQTGTASPNLQIN